MGKNKAQLLEEAGDLGVDVPEGATNRQIEKLLKPARVHAREQAEAAPVEAAESPAEEPVRDTSAHRPRRAPARLPADLHR